MRVSQWQSVFATCALVRLFTLQATGSEVEETGENEVEAMARRCCLPAATAFQILEIYQRVSCVCMCVYVRSGLDM